MISLIIYEKINLFVDSIESIKLPDSRGSRLFCLTVDDDQQGFYVELDNIIKGLNAKGENIENINISNYLINCLEKDNMLEGIQEIEKNSAEFIDHQYRILENYFIKKIKEKVEVSKAEIVVLSRIEFTYPYIINAFRIIMEFENEFSKAILIVLPGERKSTNIYSYLNKRDISSPSFRIKNIIDFRRN